MRMWDWATKLARDLASLALVLGTVWSVYYYALGGRQIIEPWKSLPENVEEVLSALEVNNIKVPPPFVEFDSAFTPEDKAYTPGESVKIVYWMRRNENCPTTLYIRWYDFETNSYRQIPGDTVAIESSITKQKQLVPIYVTIPDVKSGWWAYHPVLECDGERISPDPVYIRIENNAR